MAGTSRRGEPPFESHLPGLTTSRAQAKEQINLQIMKGKRLLVSTSMSTFSEDRLKEAREEYHKWDAFNRDLLLKLFDSPVPSQQYVGSVGPYFAPTSLASRIKQHSDHVNEKMRRLESLVERLPLHDERLNDSGSNKASAATDSVPGDASAAQIRPLASPINKQVFVVHGRNEQAREAMFAFLRAIDLKPIEWSEAIKEAIEMTGDANPYIGDVLQAVFSKAQAVVVLLTGDDLVRLGTKFTNRGETDEKLTPQARPNVIFESGLAFGKDPKRTILVELGTLRAMSDLVGRHVVRMNNTPERRQNLVSRLRVAGCLVETENRTEWLKVGDFDRAVSWPDRDIVPKDYTGS